MMKKNQVLLVSWSHVDLAFKKIIEAELGVNFSLIRFSHHHSWNTFERSIIKNAIHIAKQLWLTTKMSRNSVVILFGTNLCRMLFPILGVNNVYYIYNELPDVDHSALMLYDRFIFTHSKKIFVSSDARLKLLGSHGFNVKRVGVVDNVTFDFFNPRVNSREKRARKRAILIGTLDETRFGLNTISALNVLISNDVSVDVLPSNIKRGLDTTYKGISFLNPVPHHEVSELLKKYDYGILAYEPTSLNNIFAAPLKLYEYVNAGLRVISLFPNDGIESVRRIHPALFADFNLLNNSSFEKFSEDRRLFLDYAIFRNRQFAIDVISAVRHR